MSYEFSFIAIASAIAILSGAVGVYASMRCDALDVASGRRTAFDVANDYGANRGFYWPWSPLYVLAMLICVVFGGYLALVFLLWVVR